MKTYTRIAATLLFSLACMGMHAVDYAVTSPNGHLKATVSDNGRIEWIITHDGVTVLAARSHPLTSSPSIWLLPVAGRHDSPIE